MKKNIVILLTLMLGVLLLIPAAYAADSATATTMRLEKAEGKVQMANQNGTAIPVRDHSKMYNGYAVSTEHASYAYIGLDDKKAIKLDQSSSASVKKTGKKLELLVNYGQIYFNIKVPLAKDERLEIRTSNMVTGIRGTTGVVKKIDENSSQLYLLEGSVILTDTDPKTGEERQIIVKAGQVATSTHFTNEDGTAGESVMLRDLTEEEIAGFAAMEIQKDKELQQKILEQTNLDVQWIADNAPQASQSDEAKNADQQAEVTEQVAKRDLPPPAVVEDPQLADGDDNSNTSRIRYTVTFDTGGGTLVAEQQVVAGGKVTKPADPTMSGKVFWRWCSDSGKDTAFDFETPITTNITIYASFKTP